MKLYPWLLQIYKNIIQQHQLHRSHHATFIKTQKGLGSLKLIWCISRWLLCLKPTGINFCNKCHGCKLMLFGNHPDWYNFNIKNNNIFTVDSIREMNNKIFKQSQQGGEKIIVLSNTEKLTEAATNSLLKTLEEPPKNTWFFLINYNNFYLYPTLNSRCIIYKLFPPTEKDSLDWLRIETKKTDAFNLIALRINHGSPISAKKFINEEIWKERINFYYQLFVALKDKKLLKLLPLLCKNNVFFKIDWICFLLIDSIKFKFIENKFLINFDQEKLIEFLSFNCTNIVLDNSLKTWMRCKHRLLNISGINHELLLLEQLIVWEKFLKFTLIF